MIYIYINAREAAFLRKASPSRSLPESSWRSGWDVFSCLVPPKGVGASPIDLVESTAADRAAADVRGWGNTLSQPSADSSLCGGSLLGAASAIALFL